MRLWSGGMAVLKFGRLLSNIEVESLVIRCNGHHARCQSKMVLFQHQKFKAQSFLLDHHSLQCPNSWLNFVFLINGNLRHIIKKYWVCTANTQGIILLGSKHRPSMRHLRAPMCFQLWAPQPHVMSSLSAQTSSSSSAPDTTLQYMHSYFLRTILRDFRRTVLFRTCARIAV